MSTPHPDTPPVTATTTAPAVRPPRWSGKKTAVVAALAIGLGAGGSAVAVAAVPAGSAQMQTGQDAGGGRLGGPGAEPGQRGRGGPGAVPPGFTGRSPGTPAEEPVPGTTNEPDSQDEGAPPTSTSTI